MAETPTACRLCGSNLIVPKGGKRGRFRPLNFQFFECAKCTFLFVSPVMGPDIYDDRYYRGQGADPLVDYESEYVNYAGTPRIHEFIDLYRLAERHANARLAPQESLRWLDFGCGAGGLLKFLREKKTMRADARELPIEISGFDVGSYADKLKLDDHLQIWNWEELQSLPAASFDVISCIEVIEHIPEPGPIFELLGRLLAPNGLLLLSTGNLRSPLARLLGIRFPYCVPEIHVSLFSPTSLRAAYAKAGLIPVRVRYRGALRFKFLKNLGNRLPEPIAQTLSTFGPLLRVLDAAYGVSSMPSATRPMPTS